MLNNNTFFSTEVRHRNVRHDIEKSIQVFDLDKDSIHILQDEESSKNPLFRIKLIRARTKEGIKVKVRFFEDRSQAVRSFESTSLAYGAGVPTTEPLSLDGTLGLFSYVEGKNLIRENLNESDVREIGKIHSTLNNSQRYVNGEEFRENSEGMVERASKNLLDSGLLDEPFKIKHPHFIPVLEHEDFGIHNVIKGRERKFTLIDEESFGILPFGFGLVRPLYDKVFRITASSKRGETYLSQFDEEKRQYFRDNANYFIFMYVLRNASRKLTGTDDIESVKTLVAKAKEMRKKF